MWYLPITDRLIGLYQYERTAGMIRWHAEHVQRDGKVAHPSDERAWKHFNTVQPDFARNIPNVNFALCKDEFSPFGISGRQYSLWFVILTRYNLPSEICMEQEFIFLTILVPGPKHPKWSLDVFLQQLIQELKESSILEDDTTNLSLSSWLLTPSKLTSFHILALKIWESLGWLQSKLYLMDE